MISSVLVQLLGLFKLALFARIIIDYIRMFARNWQPNAILLGIFEVIYSITDKPMRFVQRFIPPLRIGGVALDLSFIVLLIAINVAQTAIQILL
ncbi:MAG: YggT family protein [Candidatus Planktophila sp.]|jgi:YggT family protein|tara:strand:- start:3394 stop:3675 length:282 start_codon:yes stop_codon:yes gene_type:complete